MPQALPRFSPDSTTWRAQAPTLLPMLRQAMGAGTDRIALLLPPLPAEARRAARLLMQDAARAGDGATLDVASGEILLLGVRTEVAERVGEALAALGLPAGTPWLLDPEASAPLLAWADRSQPAPRPDPGLAARLDAVLAALALDAVAVRRSVLLLTTGAKPQWSACHIAVSRRRLAAALGPDVAMEADLLAEAQAQVEARLARWSGASGPMAPMLRPSGLAAPRPGAIALLPAQSATQPARLAEARTALHAAGWAEVGLDGLDATLLPLLDLAALPASGPLLLRWSPALADRAASQTLGGLVDRDRLVLTGCADVEAMAWGFTAGLRRFAGPMVETLPGAVRPDGPA